jgi:hypothetical protein
MASSAHGTLTAGVVTTVTVDTSAKGFEVVNRDQQGEIWVRTDGQDPVPRADGTFVVLGARRFGGRSRFGAVEVRLVAEVERQFSVEGASS